MLWSHNLLACPPHIQSSICLRAGIFSKRSVVIGAGGRTWGSMCTPMETRGEQKILLDSKWICNGRASLSGWTTIDRRSQSTHHGQAPGTQDSQLVSGQPAPGMQVTFHGRILKPLSLYYTSLDIFRCASISCTYPCQSSVRWWYFWISGLSASLVALREKLKKADPNYF